MKDKKVLEELDKLTQQKKDAIDYLMKTKPGDDHIQDKKQIIINIDYLIKTKIEKYGLFAGEPVNLKVGWKNLDDFHKYYKGGK